MLRVVSHHVLPQVKLCQHTDKSAEDADYKANCDDRTGQRQLVRRHVLHLLQRQIAPSEDHVQLACTERDPRTVSANGFSCGGRSTPATHTFGDGVGQQMAVAHKHHELGEIDRLAACNNK